MPSLYLGLLTALCLTNFAGNSIFCRAALIFNNMGPLQYTGLRALIAASILVLLCLVKIIHPRTQGGNIWHDIWQESNWTGALSLFAYMICFSLGYVGIDSAPGTLIINMCVQFCMIGWGFMHGIHPNKRQYTGFAIATAGLIILLMPGLSAPPLLYSLFMAGTGFAWGVFSISGRDAHSAALATAGNFCRAAIPGFFCLVAGFLLEGTAEPLAWLFVFAGGLASSLGYILWYAIVPRYSLVNISIIQLAVPVITAILGTIFLSEVITMRLVIAAALILGGITLAIKSAAHHKAATR